jgi:hypothetical protein
MFTCKIQQENRRTGDYREIDSGMAVRRPFGRRGMWKKPGSRAKYVAGHARKPGFFHIHRAQARHRHAVTDSHPPVLPFSCCFEK